MTVKLFLDGVRYVIESTNIVRPRRGGLIVYADETQYLLDWMVVRAAREGRHGLRLVSETPVGVGSEGNPQPSDPDPGDSP